MTRDQFIKELNKIGYKWGEEGEWIVVEETGYVNLYSLKSIPDNVQFRNSGSVSLRSLESIPDNVQFNNSGWVDLNSLESMGNNVQFRNEGSVHLPSLKSIPDNVQFNNRGYVDLRSLKSIPDNVQFRNSGSVDLESLKLIPITADIDEMFPKCYDISINGEWLFLENNITFSDPRWSSLDSERVQMYESWIKNNY